MASRGVVNPSSQPYRQVRLGVLGDQINEMCAEIDLFWLEGDAAELRAFRQRIASWVRSSVCPNALVYAVEYADAALDLIDKGPGYNPDRVTRDTDRLDPDPWQNGPGPLPAVSAADLDPDELAHLLGLPNWKA